MAGGQILSKSFEMDPLSLESRNSQILTLGYLILKMAKQKNAISPTREEDYPEWYQQVVRRQISPNTPVRGCMVIKPWGYGIWENIRDALDKMFKDTGHKTHISRSLFPRVFSNAKLNMWMGLPRSVPWLPIPGWKQIRMVFFTRWRTR